MKKVIVALALIGAFLLLTAGINDRFSDVSLSSGGTDIVFPGDTANNGFETTLRAVEPTSDGVISLPTGVTGTLMSTSLATNGAEIANSVSGGTNSLIFEGTADAFELTIDSADATADRTTTIPDYTGGLPLIIAQSSAQITSTNSIADVTGSSLSLPDGWFGAGKTLKWTLYGTCSGANAAKNIMLYIDNAAIVTLATEAADVGDWKAEFILHEHTAFATQDAMGVALMDNEAVIADYATDTTDFNDGGATTVKCQIQSQHSSDDISVEYVVVEHWVK